MKIQRTRTTCAAKTTTDTLVVVGNKTFTHHREVIHNTTVEPRKVFVSWSIVNTKNVQNGLHTDLR